MFFPNGIINLLCRAVQFNYNIRHIKPYKSDTKIEDITSKICLTMSAYELTVIYFYLDIKCWNKVYYWMHTGILT